MYYKGSRPVSQMPQCTCPKHQNTPHQTEMCTFLVRSGALWDVGQVHWGNYETDLLCQYFCIISGPSISSMCRFFSSSLSPCSVISQVWANEKRCCIYNVFYHWLRPYICFPGVGGILVAVQASRLSTALHQQSIPGKMPKDTPAGCINPCRVFFGQGK